MIYSPLGLSDTTLDKRRNTGHIYDIFQSLLLRSRQLGVGDAQDRNVLSPAQGALRRPLCVINSSCMALNSGHKVEAWFLSFYPRVQGFCCQPALCPAHPAFVCCVRRCLLNLVNVCWEVGIQRLGTASPLAWGERKERVRQPRRHRALGLMNTWQRAAGDSNGLICALFFSAHNNS